MKEILIQLRTMQMFAHSAHHLVARTPFHSDHEFFSEVYSSIENDFDSVAERIIGLLGEESMELNSIIIGVANKLKNCPSIGVKENSIFYIHQLKYEDELCQLVSSILSAGVTPGTEQLLGDICNKSEARKYKIKQRLKK
jgi:DNA-binding ferritin-like protein